MITLRLYDGQVLTFADGTPEEVMRRMADAAVKRAQMQDARRAAAGQRIEGLDDSPSPAAPDLNPSPVAPGPSSTPFSLKRVASGEIPYPRSRDLEIQTQPGPPDTSIADSIRDRGQRVDVQLGSDTKLRDIMDAIEAKTGPLTDAWRVNVIHDLQSGKSIGQVMYNLQHYRRDSLGDTNFDIDYNSRYLPDGGSDNGADHPKVGPVTPLPLVGPAPSRSPALTPDFSDVESGSSTAQIMTVHDDVTGRSFQFPIGTPEPEIRRAIDDARAEQSTRPTAPAFDLSRLRPNPNPQYDLSGIRDQPVAPASAKGPLGRSSEWWRSVTGSDNPEDWAQFARDADLRRTESQGAEAMAKSGFVDRTTYYENPETGERYPKHHKSGTMPDPDALDPQYRPGALVGLRDAYDMEGRGWTSPETRAETGEFFSGLPNRVAGSVLGAAALPVRAVSAAAAGLRNEAGNLPNMGLLPARSGEAFRQGFTKDLETNPIGRGAEIIQRDIVDPAQERLLDASIRAGNSPLSAAGVDTGQMAVAEALNPVNYIGPGELSELARGAEALTPTAMRMAALEARGGARTLESVPGLVTREYGAGRAGSELAQAEIARSGRYLPGAREPLFHYNEFPTSDPNYAPDRFQGVIPDKIKELRGRSWRSYGGDRVPLEKPMSPAPMPRSVERPPLPLPKMDITNDVTDDQVRNIVGIWNYASRRYPKIASEVKEITTAFTGNRGAFFEPATGRLGISPDADLGTLMHEMTHVAQHARRQNIFNLVESERYSVRAGDVYSRIPQPVPADLTGDELASIRSLRAARLADAVSGGKGTASRVDTGGGLVPDGMRPLDPREYSDATGNLSIPVTPAGYGGDAEGRAFTAWLEKNGINPDHADRYGELPDLRDQFFELHNPDPTPPREFYYPETGNAGPGSEGGPRRLYAGGPPPAPPRPESDVARDMGWVHPANLPGSPQAAVDPIHTAQFQTNLAAQLAGGNPTPESQAVAKYIVDRSDDVFRAIGPPQTWDTLEEMASRLGRTKESFLNEPSHWNTLSPEARLRLLYVIKGNESHITDLQAKLAAGAATDVEKADLLRAIDARGNLIQLGAKSGSAYARALNSLKMEARLALDDSQLLRQQLYRRYSRQLDAEKPLMDALSRLDPTKPDELQAFLRHVDKPTLRQYIQEFWVSSILSSPASHERNLIGNAVNAVMENAVVRPASALWDAARTAGTQAPREVFFRETPQAILGMGRGLRQGLRRGLEVLRRGYDPESMSGKLFPVRSAFARSQNRVVREVVGPVVTMPLRMLSASDAVAKTVNWTAEIYAQAARTAAKEGLSGSGFYSRVANLVANPEPAMIEAADQFALKATFNDETSAVGKAIANIRDIPKASSPNPALQAGIETYRTGMGFMLPFIHIADRLMVRGMEYSPISFLTSAGARRAGNFAESADLAARASIGSLVMAYAASLAMEGRITGAAPENEGERAAFYGASKQPWSVRTEDGTWVPYGQLQPIGAPFALVASAYKGWSEHGEATDTEKLGHAAAQIGSYLTDQSYLDALSKMMDVISGGQTAGRAFSDVTANTAWGFVPYSGLTRTVARAIDPRVIEARTISDKLTQNMPVASLGLLGKLDPWGEEIVPVGGRKRAVLASGTVMLPSKEKVNPLDQELERIGMPLGYVGQTLTDRKKKITLSDDEHYLYQQMSGRASRLLLQELFAREGWQDLDAETQRDEVTKAVGAARKFGRIVVLRYHNGAANYPGLDPSLGLIRMLSGQKE